MKNIVIYSIIAYIVLHAVTILSYIPWCLKSFSLEEFGISTEEELMIETMSSFQLGFVVAVIFSVIILSFLFIEISKERKYIVAVVISFIYLSISIFESRIDNYMFTLPSSAYSRIFESYFPLLIIPFLFLILGFYSSYMRKN